MEPSSLTTLRFRVEDQVALVTLDRPDRGNAWTTQMAVELDRVLRAADADPAVRVVVVTGAGATFSVGADLKSGSIDRPGDDDVEPPAMPLLPSRMTKPVIAAMNGHAVGAGISFAMHCDVRLLAETAKVGFAFVRRGVIPEMGMHWVVPRILGMAVATDLLLTGRTIGASEALELGVVHRVLPAADVLRAGLELAQEIAVRVAPLSAAATKQLLWEGLDETWERSWQREREAFAACAGHPDAVEGVLSFMEKRPPRWTGRPTATERSAMTQMAGVVTIVATEGREAELLEALEEMRTEVVAEPGCELYFAVQLAREPRTFVLVERYRDRDALRAHQANPALARFGDVLAPLTESMEIRIGSVAVPGRSATS
jgi:enoyl-CoA hydratase/carnithine racemase/quinol monooxygenase YgiN